MKILSTKRIFDIFLSLLLIILSIPFFILISCLITIFNGYPILYIQKRVGIFGKEFYIYKFRTMRNEIETNSENCPLTIFGDKRITNIGLILRALKLDEIPQLINVLKGDMSFVGPRPELKEFTDLYDQNKIKILTIKPGITDIASLIFRNESDLLSGEKNYKDFYLKNILPSKLELGLIYKNNKSLLLDINIILITFLIIFSLKKNLIVSNFIINKKLRKKFLTEEIKIKKIYF